MKTDFKTANYFSNYLIFSAVVLLIIGLVAITLNLIVAIILCFGSLIIFTTHYRLQLDLDNKVYHDYVWVLGMKHGEKGRFDRIEYLFVKKSKVSQTMYSRGASSTIKKELYDGYLKFSNGKKIHLSTKENKADLIANLKGMGTQLNVRVIDYSNIESVEVK